MTCPLQLARDLAERLTEIADEEDRDLTLAACVRILADASDSDAYTALHDAADAAEYQAKENMRRRDEAELEEEWMRRRVYA